MSGKDNIMDNNNNGNDFNGNGFEDYSDARKYTYNPYTGQSLRPRNQKNQKKAGG